MTEPNLTGIKNSILEFTTLSGQFISLRKNVNRIDDAVDKLFGWKNVKPDEIKTTIDDITAYGQEIGIIKNDVIIINYNVDAHEQKIGTISTDIAAIKNNVDENNRRTDTIVALIVQTRDNVNEHERRLGIIGPMITTNNNNIDMHGRRIETISTDIAANKNNIDTHEQKIKTISADIAANKNNIDAHEQKIKTISTDIAANKNNIDTTRRMSDTIVTFITQIRDDHKRRIETISTDVAANKNNIDVHEREIWAVKIDVTAINDKLPKLTEQLVKMKTPHGIIGNSIYTVQHGSFTWTPTDNIILITATVKGIYRFTLISLMRFDISSSRSSGFNSTISTIIDKDANERFIIRAVDRDLTRASITWYVEFVVKI